MKEQPQPGPGTLDWGVGHYERTAAQLLPAARVVVERAAPAEGEHVVDVGCGTGNAALLAAGRGARVTGVDPASRLLEVARQQARQEGLEATFVGGDAAALPVPDEDADVVVSVFAVIFAPDPRAAAAEMARVAKPDGRIVISAWIPEGAISQSARVAREAIARALGREPQPPGIAWHQREALAGLLGPFGFEVELEEHEIAFTDTSPSDYFEAEFQSHPLWVAGRALLEPRGELEALRERTIEILDAENEDPAAFRVTSRYVIATARRP